LRPFSLKYIELIKKIAIEGDVRYYDLAYLKEKIRAMLLARDPNNI
jgi:CII-binding regulator of phage lambda lysogenization HflD